MKQLPVIDKAYTLNLLHDDKAVANLFYMFAKTLPELQRSLAEAHQAYDVQKMRDIAHTLKGEVSYCGAPRISAALHHFQ